MSSTNFGSVLIFLSCLLVLVIYYAGKFFLMGGVLFLDKYVFFSTTMIGVGIFTLGGEFGSSSNIVSIV